MSYFKSSVHSSGCGKVQATEEYDSHSRQAIVYLFTRPIKSTLVATIGDENQDEFKHWALVVAFKDGSIRTVEAGASEGGEEVLEAHFTKESPREKGKYYELGAIETSPAKLREQVIDNQLNGSQYFATTNNCQNWVTEMARLLGETIHLCIKNYKTLDEARPFFASAVASKQLLSKSSPQVVKDSFESVFMRLSQLSK